MTRSLLGLAVLSALSLAACQAPSDPGQAAVSADPTPAAAPATSAPATTPPPKPVGDPSQVAVERLQSQSPTATGIDISSAELKAGESIPRRFTDYGDSISPSLTWSAVDAARTYAVLLEDPDADQPQPFVHWVAWNIPAGTTHLGADMAKDARPMTPAGMQQGMNGKQRTGYFGPRPPAGDPPHHYHFEVFALDDTLTLPDDADRDALVDAMASHVLAKGELVATSQAPDDAE